MITMQAAQEANEFAGTLQEAIAEMDAAQQALQREIREWNADMLKKRFELPVPLRPADRYFNAQGFEVVCAWCHPGDHRPNISHGMCPAHLELELAKLQARDERSPQRSDPTKEAHR